MICSYQQVCPVLFGPGASEQTGKKVKELNGKNVLCVYDKGVEGSGIADRIVQNIKKDGYQVFCYNKVLPDAPKETVHEAGLIAKENRVNVIVGIGGGSSLDTAKAVSVLADNPMPVSRYYAGSGQPFEQQSGLILIPTASGTGSEVTAISVIHDADSHAKETILRSADLAIVDPNLTLTVPPAVTASTGMDALSHAVEAYTTNCGNPKSDILALHAIKLISQNLEAAVRNGSDLTARTNLSLASNLAGMAFNDASVHFGHAAAHEAGIRFHIPHGNACAVSLPEVITFSAGVIPERVCDIAGALGIDLPEGAGGEEAGRLAAEKLRDMMRKVGIPSLKSLGISREEFVSCAEGAVMKNWFVTCAPAEVTVSVMETELGYMYDNYQ